MQQRAKRMAIAIVLTAADVATFNSYSGVIWQTWVSIHGPKLLFSRSSPFISHRRL